MSNVIKQQIDARIGTNSRLIAQTVFMDLEFAGDTFIVGVGTSIHVDETLGATVADFAEIFLFDNVFHFFFLGFSFYDVFLEFLDVAEDVRHALGVGAAEGETSYKIGVGVVEGLLSVDFKWGGSVPERLVCRCLDRE